MKANTRASPQKVWSAWVQSHVLHCGGTFASGSSGYMQQGKRKIPYQIIDVVPGKSFSVLWKALFVRFVFLHKVTSSWAGAEIEYDFQIKGPLAWMVRWALSSKINANLSLVLKEFIRQLEAR